MRLGIISDIHGNLHALNNVLEHMNSVGVDKKVCLGDLVGYGPYPNECIDLVASNFNFIVMGDHDNAVFDDKEAAAMNPLARQGVDFTKEKITRSNLDILKGLEYGYLTDGILLVHGSPSAPFGSVRTDDDAVHSFSSPIADFDISFVGHTHIPAIWEKKTISKVAFIRPQFQKSEDVISKFEYTPKEASIVNVGSVGQSRDGDKRATYVIFDTESRLVSIYKIPYSVDRTIAKMQSLSFPTETWSRLMYGI